MKLSEIYDLAVATGIDADLRRREVIEAELAKRREDFDKLSEEDKALFDEAGLNNPYSDTRILAGDPETEIKGILAGIDMETPEVILADRLREKGESIDLIMSHHPEGRALASLYAVMGMQADVWHAQGVPINVGDALMDPRAQEVRRGLSPTNHDRAVDAAKLLGFPIMCVHTPADNLVSSYLQKMFDDEPPVYLNDVVKKLKTIPEYQAGAKINAGPSIVAGSGGRRAGKVLVLMTGGTGGPEGAIEKLAAAGVGTVIEMHMGEKLRKKAEEHNLNVIIAGHIASDNIGMNLWLDKLEDRGVEIKTCSGLVRVERG
jgi:putative NIF3 family GTP cyclohydrolase 1 type 2